MLGFLTKKYSVQTNTKLVRDKDGVLSEPKDAIFEPIDPFLGPEVVAEYAGIAKDFITHTAVVVTGAYVICRIAKAVFK